MGVSKSIAVLIFLAIICMVLSSPAAADDLTIVATPKAFTESQRWIDFLKSKEIPVSHITPKEFAEGGKAKYIVLMGGLDESDGIREIVKKIISEEEFQAGSLNPDGKAFVKYVLPNNAKGPQKWGETVSYLIFIGPDLKAAVTARENSRDMWWEELATWFDIFEGSAVPPY